MRCETLGEVREFKKTLGVSSRARFHHAVFVVGKGATDFYPEDWRGRLAAQGWATKLTDEDGKPRYVRTIMVGDSYMALDTETGEISPRVHGNDGYHWKPPR